MLWLKRTIEDNETPSGRIFDLAVQCLIVVSLVCFSIETLPNLSRRHQDWLNTLEVIVVAIFTVEYLLRLLVADRKLRLVFSFYGVIDFVAIAPFYLASGVDLRSLRATCVL